MSIGMNAKGYEANLELNRLWLPDGIYWPFKRLPESKLDTYAIACVETALKYSEDAQQIYAAIIQSWELPECQVLIGDYVQAKQDTRTYLSNQYKAVIRNQPLPSWPNAWIEVIAKHKDNTDFHKLLKYVADFVLTAFNRKQDVENQAPKVLPRESPYLGKALVFSSLLDYLSEKPELRGPRVIPDNELTQFRWFCRTLSSNPTTRMSRQVRRQIVRTLRRNFNLHHYSKLLGDAEKWYKSRVNPGTIEDYLQELADLDIEGEKPIYPDRGRIENDIAPCDEATGYPRQWRK